MGKTRAIALYPPGKYGFARAATISCLRRVPESNPREGLARNIARIRGILTSLASCRPIQQVARSGELAIRMEIQYPFRLRTPTYPLSWAPLLRWMQRFSLPFRERSQK